MTRKTKVFLTIIFLFFFFLGVPKLFANEIIKIDNCTQKWKKLTFLHIGLKLFLPYKYIFFSVWGKCVWPPTNIRKIWLCKASDQLFYYCPTQSIIGHLKINQTSLNILLCEFFFLFDDVKLWKDWLSCWLLSSEILFKRYFFSC